MNNFAYTIFYVADVERTISFYESAFGFRRKFIAPGAEYGELDTGTTTLSFAVHTLASGNLSKGYRTAGPDDLPPAVEVGIATNDVDGTISSAVKAGAVLYEPAKVKPWGQTVGYVRDPDGFLIEICSPMLV